MEHNYHENLILIRHTPFKIILRMKLNVEVHTRDEGLFDIFLDNYEYLQFSG